MTPIEKARDLARYFEKEGGRPGAASIIYALVAQIEQLPAKLLEVHSALDDGLGDTDASHIESDRELRDQYPFQWAAERLMLIINTIQNRDKK